MIDFSASDAEALTIATAERFAREELRPNERRHEAAGYGDELRARYEDLGLASLGMPAEVGASDLPLAVRVAVWSRLAEGDPAAPLALSAVGPLDGPLASGAPLRELVSGGSRKAVTTADDVRIDGSSATGTLPWVPAADPAALVILDGAGVFVVADVNARALATRPCGLWACGAAEIRLDAAPCDRIAGPEEAARVAADCRAFAAALMLGAARGAHDHAARYAQERVAFGRPIAHHQGLAFQLADAAMDLDAADLLLGAAASAGRHDALTRAYVLAVQVASRVVERSLQAMGGHGYLHDHPVEKRMRDVRALASLYGGGALAESEEIGAIVSSPDALEVAP